MSSFMNYQRSYLHPTIKHVWNRYQDYYIQDIVASEDQIVIGGDGRADTPGHSAKFGSYSIMNLEESIVLGVQLVQVCTVDYINASDNKKIYPIRINQFIKEITILQIHINLI